MKRVTLFSLLLIIIGSCINKKEYTSEQFARLAYNKYLEYVNVPIDSLGDYAMRFVIDGGCMELPCSKEIYEFVRLDDSIWSGRYIFITDQSNIIPIKKTIMGIKYLQDTSPIVIIKEKLLHTDTFLLQSYLDSCDIINYKIPRNVSSISDARSGYFEVKDHETYNKFRYTSYISSDSFTNDKLYRLYSVKNYITKSFQ